VTQIYPGRLTRYNVESSNSTTIKASEWLLPGGLSSSPAYGGSPAYWQNTYEQSGGQIRQGPDGRMYIADQAYNYGMNRSFLPQDTICKINVINSPDAPDPNDIGLVLGGVSLPQGACSVWGLPQMATVYKPKIVLY